MDPANYQANIAQARARRPRGRQRSRPSTPQRLPSPLVAFSLLVSDASFACPALQVDRWTAARGVPTYAYQFNDDNAPVNIVGASLGLSTPGQNSRICSTSRTPRSRPCSTLTQALAACMRTDWAGFADRLPSIARLPGGLTGQGAVARAVAVAGHDRLPPLPLLVLAAGRHTRLADVRPRYPRALAPTCGATARRDFLSTAMRRPLA